MVWEVKHVQITVKDDRKFARHAAHLNRGTQWVGPDGDQVFREQRRRRRRVCKKPCCWRLFSRWHVERCFEDQKQEVGLDQLGSRHWLGLGAAPHTDFGELLFWARVRTKFRGEKAGPDR